MAAAGAIESVAAILQLKEQFLAPNINCEDLHSEIKTLVHTDKIPTTFQPKNLNLIAKASFGFGDVNACVLFKRFIV